MARDDVILMTDHSSTEGSRDVLALAVERLTGRAPILVDARHFMSGGDGRVDPAGTGLRLTAGGRSVTADTVLVYEIPPHRRRDFEACQHLLLAHGARSLGTGAEAWRAATEKDLTVARLTRDGIPHMPTITLRRPTPRIAVEAFERLGGDVWARPTVGMGGGDVFHVTTPRQLADAAVHYADLGVDWLIARDAGNFTPDGRRHQYRAVVLGERIVRAVEHVQPDPDAPCNESRGAVSTLLAVDDLPAGLAELAVAATRSLGLPFAGVDLAAESGGVVFEVNVHPVFGTDQGLETVALPYVAAHLDPWSN
ncbi:RimK family alpha-L-glutamate ligase [Kitasatospora sp. NPDC094011]|uniref:ATP-grasp domain-containing protein n=1 Tax=Kitasatospora sp. NPDC094011 TaxID=3364090 RepID=UPI003823D647